MVEAPIAEVPEPKEEPKDSVPPAAGAEPLLSKPKEEPEEEPKARKKRGAPKDPKIQCPICLRFYCGWRSQPGGHVCHPVKIPDPPKSIEPKPIAPEGPAPESPEDPMASSMVMAPEPVISHSDVVRFMARERMNRHERKRERWQQQMFG